MNKISPLLGGFCSKWALVVAVALLLIITVATINSNYSPSAGSVELTSLKGDDSAASFEQTKSVVQTRPVIHQHRTQTGAVDVNATLEPLIEPMAVQALLYEIEFDADGNVIVDDKARRLLERAIFQLGQNQDQLSLDLLDQMIRAGLPGSQGDEVADVFKRYYEYKSAESEFVSAAEVNGAGSAEEVSEQLRELRQGYLGYELAKQLFAEEEAYLQNVIMLMKKAEAEVGAEQ